MRGMMFALLAILGWYSAYVPCLGSTPQPAPEVGILRQETGGYLITTPSYTARIAADGNIHSLTVNNIEFLDDQVTGSAGISFFVNQPIALPTMTLTERELTATDGIYTVRYAFEEGFITLTLRQSSSQGAAFVAVCVPQIAYVDNLDLAGVAAAPTDYAWEDVKVTMPTGEYLEFRGGSRIWAHAMGRQAWERSNIAPNKEYTLTLVPGQGPPRTPDLTQLTTLTSSYSMPDRLTPGGQPVELDIRFQNNSNQMVASEMAIHVLSSTGTLLLDEHKSFTCPSHQAVTLPWTLSPTEPDFYIATCSVNLDGATVKLVTTFGYDVAAIAPIVQRPLDFTDYWNRVTAEANAADVKLTRLEDRGRSTGTVTVYRIGVEADGVTCFGWLAVPKFPGRYPGLLLLPGDRVRNIGPNPSLADCGFVVMTIEPTGQPVDGTLKPLITRVFSDLDDPMTFGLRDITIRYLRAITALAGVAEVDPHRLAVTGVGLGGGMAMNLGALDERILAVAPDVPFLCHIEYGMVASEWPYREVSAYVQANPDRRDEVLQTLRYYDVANFVEQLTCPVLISAGIEDSYSRPATIYGVANRLPGPHALRLYIAGHEGGGIGHWSEKMRWLGQVLGAPSPITVGKAGMP